MAQKVIILKSISKKYPIAKTHYKDINIHDFWVLKDINIEIDRGKTIGIIGRNGAGKTTLLNIISGILSPTKGEVFIDGRVMGLFNIGLGFQDELSGRENIFLNGSILGADRKEIQSRLDPIIEFSELGEFINMPLGTYSQGMRLRLGFSIVANLNFDILVIDEVLAVGDSLFQNKCLKCLTDFKRKGKTLIITTQDMAMVERLCDECVLLDHGHILFRGKPRETIDRYRTLLTTERFFVGPEKIEGQIIENTKKWTDDISGWGKEFGTEEVAIESVTFINRFGFNVDTIKTREPLKIKVNFKAMSKVDEPHFGIAIFRDDGIYCYGPNTLFDGYRFEEIRPGRGYFILEYKSILLASGDYRVSVAIWDKNEKLAFDYHNGFYKFKISGGDNSGEQLLNIPYTIKFIKDTNAQSRISVRMLDLKGQEKDIFFTNEAVKITVDNKYSNRKLYLFRDDGIFCQYIDIPSGNNAFCVFFDKLPLLPGHYIISSDTKEDIFPFRMVFNRQDHGTVFLEHNWRWRLP